MEQLLRYRSAEALVLATGLAAAVKAKTPMPDDLAIRLAEALAALRADPTAPLLAEIGEALMRH